ncbi:UNVERIFIED_CONTAM: hypothetical protein Scaly_2212200 [Sesamum calycinum]|uniref:Reverse transcriptase domain-containing protein n=1 Tax=Sesamum calycinum TaxID=2727403 RepID=A0AAW2MN93_9LAMI
MEEVIEGGPWLFQGQPIVLQFWEQGMSLRRQQHTQIPVWIRLRHLPMEYWTDEGLSTVASGVGTPLYTDGITKECSRLDYARVCVMLDYNSELPKHLVVISPVLRNATCPATKKRNLAPPITIFVQKSSGHKDPQQHDRNDINAAPVPASESAGPASVCHNSRDSVLDKGKEIVLYNSYDALATELITEAEKTRVSLANVQRIRRNLLVNWSWFDDYSGPAGRIWLVWNPLEVGVDILRVDSQFIHCRAFNKRLHTRCLITVLYGDYDIIPRRNLWRALCNLSTAISDEPWLVLGDFNAVMDDSEVCGRAADTSMSMTEFRTCIQDTGLVQLPTTGCPYTWHNCSEGPRSLWKRFLNSVEEIWKHRIAGTAMYEIVCKLKLLKAEFRKQKKLKESAPGPDGYTSEFYRAAWSVVGQDLFKAVASFSVSINGSIHGFFKGGRGLRQGDPLSPYLFVLVMEIGNALLKYRVKQATEFQYHWKCKDFGLINLCFADDVLLFCKAHLPSIKVLTDTLTEFAAMSGLKINPAKSQIILSRSVQQERQQILDYLGFQEGTLPIKYLGIPLTSSRLTMSDCRPLIDKVEARLAGWNHQNLSYAGRLQLIKSVLSTLHMYWASAFILPKGILKILEKKMRRFLWHGSGNAKVAWEQICKPKQEGGLGIRSLMIMNQALMLKQLWRIIQNDGTSIWVEWIQRHRLRQSTIWTFNGATGSWGWKKLLKLRPLLQRGVIYKVGDGASFSLWQDVWHERGPLCLTFPRGPVITGLPLSSPLSSVLQRNQWSWPASTDADIAEIISQLPPTQPSAADKICWRSSSGKYTTKSAVSLIQPTLRVSFGKVCCTVNLRFRGMLLFLDGHIGETIHHG